MEKFTIPPGAIAELNRELMRRADHIGKGVKQVILEESKPLLRDLVNLTPPRAVGMVPTKHSTIAPQAQRKQGMAAIESDINRMFRPLKSIEAIYNPKTRRFADVVQDALDYDNWDDISDLLYEAEILPFKPKILLEATEEFHNKWRVPSTGKLSKRIKNPWLIVNEKSIDDLKRTLKARVGYGKSGWTKALNGLGMGVPGWINKGGPGTHRPEQSKAGVFVLTMGNRVSYMQGRADRIVFEAVNERTRKLFERTEYMLKHSIK